MLLSSPNTYCMPPPHFIIYDFSFVICFILLFKWVFIVQYNT
jgi:hypothetical protein